jgi:pSer/pThr/pTyr-binding forkhead associated (FHA) protein
VPSAAFASTAASATAAMPGVAALDPEALPEGAPRILAGFLISYDVQPLGRAWPIFQGTNRVGRQGAGVSLDVELDHPTASSRHAVILASACPGRMKLEDTGSTNGTMLNGARLARGARHEIKDGDRIRFGLLSTIVKIA